MALLTAQKGEPFFLPLFSELTLVDVTTVQRVLTTFKEEVAQHLIR